MLELFALSSQVFFFLVLKGLMKCGIVSSVTSWGPFPLSSVKEIQTPDELYGSIPWLVGYLRLEKTPKDH